jgi:hypothetical protein
MTSDCDCLLGIFQLDIAGLRALDEAYQQQILGPYAEIMEFCSKILTSSMMLVAATCILRCAGVSSDGGPFWVLATYHLNTK